MKKILFILTFITISLFAKTNTTQKHILVLHSYNKSMSWIANIDKSIVDTLKPNENNYILYIEYMDTKRIFTPKYIEQLKQLYKNKYKDIKLDLILSSDNNAFDFLRENRDEIFGNIPTSFCGVNFFKDSDIAKLTNYTGATEEFDAKQTIEAAIKLYPKAKNIFIVNDYLTTGRAWDKTIKEQLKGINKNITYSDNQTIEELQTTLKTISKDTIVLLGVYYKDKSGKFFTYEKIGEMIATSSNAPVFCLLEFNLKKGVVGGSVIGGYYQGEAMSKIAKKILSGVEVSKLAVQKEGATKFVFDYNGIKKYNMDIKNIPQNSIILNKPISYYDKHKNIILISIAIIILLIVIIIMLIINIKKRKEIQVLLENSQKEIEDINNNLKIKIKKEIQKNTLAQEKLFKSEKMASMGEMIGNIAHQWRQPLSIISTASTGMKMQKEFGSLSDEQFYNNCKLINDNSQYLSKTIDDFRDFIKGNRVKKVFNLSENINSFLHLVEGSIKSNNINLILDLEDGIKIDGYENELTQCLINIFNNAKDILSEIKNEQDRFLFIKTIKDNNSITIKFKDSGGGIAEDILPKIFEPYFTTKHKSQGTGLGLNMSYNLIVDGMHGTIEAINQAYTYEDKEYIGAEFIISLPIF
ncbi:MAG: hypothetical protein DRG78_03990 [Epsilonproteobacteria bacterium]|nr:MAG: hypothetical protein DRG78_03990 [Campylobacterota bacterium]